MFPSYNTHFSTLQHCLSDTERGHLHQTASIWQPCDTSRSLCKKKKKERPQGLSRRDPNRNIVTHKHKHTHRDTQPHVHAQAATSVINRQPCMFQERFECKIQAVTQANAWHKHPSISSDISNTHQETPWCKPTVSNWTSAEGNISILPGFQ